MGFCWSGENGGGGGGSGRPCRAGHYVPCCAGWVGPTALLCIYAFCSMVRPIEPFLTEFLTTYKNLTAEQVNRQVGPVWTYSGLILLIPVLLVTDSLRSKPVIVLQGLAYVGTTLLLLFGAGVHAAQLAFFCYGVATAADVASLSYIYSTVPPGCFQRVTSYVRGATLLGYAAGALLAQLLVSAAGASLFCLAVITLIAVSAASITTFFLPMPKARRPREEARGHSGKVFTWMKSVGRMFRALVLDCRKCYSSAAVVFFCVWAATGRCGFYQVANYIQLLWENIQPQNFTAYNGAADGISTLTGAAAAVAVGHTSLEWAVWGELILGGFTFLMTGAIFLLDLTDDIWLSYTFYTLFKTVYLGLTTVCTFQIAKKLSRQRYALVFGANNFVGSVLQSVLTAVVINTETVRLTITSQYVIYALYFAAIALLFTVRGVYTVRSMKRPAGGNQTERATDLPEGPKP